MTNKKDTQQLINQLSKETAKLTPLGCPIKRSIVWLIPMLVWCGVFFAVWGARPDLAIKWSEPLYIAENITALLAALTALIAANTYAYPDCAGKSWIKWLPAIPLIGFLYSIYIEYSHMPNPKPMVDAMLANRVECPLEILLFALGPAVILVTMIKKAATTHLKTTTFLAILSVTLLAYVFQRQIELTDDIPHIITWHLLPILCLSILGASIGRWVLRW